MHASADDTTEELTGENVYTTPGANNNRYHTDPDCRALNGVDHLYEWTRSNIDKTHTHCQYCQHGLDVLDLSGGSRDHYRSLVEAAMEASDDA